MIEAPPRARTWLWPLAVANLVANVGIVITGGAVRLTGSGLGCPSWPRCTEESYIVHPALGINGVIEFGNRMLTWVLAAIAVACWVAAWRSGSRRAFRLATVVALGVPAQAVIGGITVLTDLNPWIVSFHLLVSMGIIAVCVVLLDALRGPPRPDAGLRARRLGWLVLVCGWLVLYLGTVVTGSGPHAGDLEAPRNDLDPVLMSHVHAWAVYLLLALTVGLVAVTHRAGLRVARSAALALLGVEFAQALVGFAQYFTGLPEVLVGLHLLGAATVSACLTWAVLAARPRCSTTNDLV